MNFALVVSGLRYYSQTNFTSGIKDAVIHDGNNLTIFTCDAWGYTTSQYNEGESNIFNMIRYKNYDGIILHGDTLQNIPIVNSIASGIVAANIPGLSINKHFDGLMYAGVENTSGIAEIVDHLVNVHHRRRINFVTGPVPNDDSRERLKSFRDSMKKLGLTVRSSQIFIGDYHPASGTAAVRRWLQDANGRLENMPDAIVCANDEMAIGVCNALHESGIRVPEDISVTGYDNTFSGKVSSPALTTVDSNMYELGSLSYHMLVNKINRTDDEQSDSVTIPNNVIYRSSCGCAQDDSNLLLQTKNVQNKYIKRKMHTVSFAEILKSSAAEFTGTIDFNTLYLSISRYLSIAEINTFYMCLNPDTVNTDYYSEQLTGGDRYTAASNILTVPLAITHGEHKELADFSKEYLLPKSCTKDLKGEYFVVMPLHFQNKFFGYCVIGNSPISIDSELFHLFILNISNAIENIHQQTQLAKAVEKLNKLWIYDSLTNIMNRAGFERFYETVIIEAKKYKKDILILFMDLDHLKAVNDTYGHDTGDIYICAMANILRKLHRHGEIIMRYGGDEFVVMGYGYDDNSAAEYIQEIEHEAELYNNTSAHAFTLSVSIGYTLIPYDSDFDIKQKIEEADQYMYKVKQAKKSRK